MVKKIVKIIVAKLNSVYKRSDEDVEKMEYMLEVLFDNVIVLLVAFLLSAPCGCLKEASVCFVGFALLRTFAGGIHMKTRSGCTLMTSSFIIGGGIITKILHIPAGGLWAMLVVDLVWMILFAPRGTKINPINPKFKKIRKVESIITVCVFMIVLLNGSSLWGRGLAIGATLGTLTIWPER